MDWNSAVWLYCERGMSSALWAEPLNAASTIGYFLAALLGLWAYRVRLPMQRSVDHLLLIALILATALGALAFHLLANQWSELTHLLPVHLFFMVYFSFAMARFLTVPPGWAGLLLGLFVVLTLLAMTMTCSFYDLPLQPSWARGATACLNGGGAHIPALAGLVILSWRLQRKGHKAAGAMQLATLLLALSLLVQAVDHYFCASLSVFGYSVGTHFIWHLLTGSMMFVMLRAALLHPNVQLVQEILPPRHAYTGRRR